MMAGTIQSTLNFNVRKIYGTSHKTPSPAKTRLKSRAVSVDEKISKFKLKRHTTLPSPASSDAEDEHQSLIGPTCISEGKNKSPRKRHSPWIASKHGDENTPTSSPNLGTNRPTIVTSLTPVQLFQQDVSSYQAVKSVLVATGSNVPLPGREKEIAKITSFLHGHLIANQRPGSLYISGAPGTGKTACLNQILQAMKFEKYEHKTVMINCMTLRAVNAIYERIYLELRNGVCSPSSSAKSVTSMQIKLKKLMTSGKRMILLVLDEIDCLESKDQQILYTVFEWPTLGNSKLVLIGIANALDLTDRVLPRLHGHSDCLPRLLHFVPYSYDQCLNILQSRLQQVCEDGKSIIKPAALQFCARKVASVSGDIRKALDICRRAVEIVESEVRNQKILQPQPQNGGEDSPNKRGRSPLTISRVTPTTALGPKTNETVGLELIVSILNDVYGNPLTVQMQKGDQDDEDRSLPLHQKVLLCTLLLVVQKGKSKEVTIGKLHEVYCRVCKKRQVSHLDHSDFSNICILVESRGLIGIKKNKNYRMSKVSLKVNESEIEFALQDRTLLGSILQDTGCI